MVFATESALPIFGSGAAVTGNVHTIVRYTHNTQSVSMGAAASSHNEHAAEITKASDDDLKKVLTSMDAATRSRLETDLRHHRTRARGRAPPSCPSPSC